MPSQSRHNRPLVVLVHPVTGFWDMYRSAPSLPLNLLHAASMLMPDYDVALVDMRVHRRWRARLAELLKRDPVLVGLTTMIGPAIGAALDAARFVKGRSAVPVALGGVHATLARAAALAEPDVDYVVCGEGERGLRALADALQGETAPGRVPGVASHAAPDPDPALPAHIDINAAPDIPYALIEPERYMQVYDGVPGYLSMETSRGCPRACAYCFHSTPDYAGWRAQSADVVYERARELKRRFGVRGLYFVDDNFFIDRDRALAVAHAMRRLGLHWQVQGVDVPTLRAMDHATLRTLARSGLARITIGVESGSDRVRRMIHKKPEAAAVLDTIRRMRRHPFIVYGSFIVNFPGETAQDVRRTMKLITDLCRANPRFRHSPVYQFVPFPGTEISARVSEQGFAWPQRLRDWNRVSFETGYGFDNAGLGEDFYRALYFVTLFSDSKYREYLAAPGLRLLSRVYRPVATARLRRGAFRHMPEMHAFRLVSRVYEELRAWQQ